ncbi:hypothetical protein K437DRAFT_268116 [Tilletiaria anomala UBC 951]|uniref:RTA1-domain-containing protein n=1 Tax=Tilletiaria anomala (strain ATCC 24038 / CBS 436.72 / UBC 951) TaxID=1037660 RepID=A0A066W1P2_TILAU|nr:uncharacterized protein K437DRAFT_268116 [Tilletiaria anomala UBC 951]KDN46468.1 hypothetical protein K437DRAFT_268116 [Tilletiaria anomala UBC 951]
MTSELAPTTLPPVGSPWRYLPNLGANCAFAVIYAVWCTAAVAYILRTRKPRWGWCMPAGLFFSSLGFVLRCAARGSDASLESIPLYAVQSLFVILSPCAFLAFNYIAFGRTIVALDPALAGCKDAAPRRRARSAYSPLPPQLFGRVFVWSDVVTFLVQATGGGLQATGGTTATLGSKIFLFGVTLQAVSYLVFVALVVTTHVRLLKESSAHSLDYMLSSHPAMRMLACLYFSSVFFVVRSIYRIVEMAEGYEGMLMSNEGFVIALDTVPLIVATGIWLVY